MASQLVNDLLELSKEVRDDNKVQSYGSILTTLELSDDIEMPLRFKAKVFKPGFFKGYNFKAEDIKRNMFSIFKKIGNIANNELNIDHKNNRKDGSSVLDLAGSVVDVSYDENNNVLSMDCEVTNPVIAEMVARGTLKYVSLRISPKEIVYENGMQFAKDFDFEELSIVRTPAYDEAHIEYIY